MTKRRAIESSNEKEEVKKCKLDDECYQEVLRRFWSTQVVVSKLLNYVSLKEWFTLSTLSRQARNACILELKKRKTLSMVEIFQACLESPSQFTLSKFMSATDPGYNEANCEINFRIMQSHVLKSLLLFMPNLARIDDLLDFFPEPALFGIISKFPKLTALELSNRFLTPPIGQLLEDMSNRLQSFSLTISEYDTFVVTNYRNALVTIFKQLTDLRKFKIVGLCSTEFLLSLPNPNLLTEVEIQLDEKGSFDSSTDGCDLCVIMESFLPKCLNLQKLCIRFDQIVDYCSHAASIALFPRTLTKLGKLRSLALYGWLLKLENITMTPGFKWDGIAESCPYLEEIIIDPVNIQNATYCRSFLDCISKLRNLKKIEFSQPTVDNSVRKRSDVIERDFLRNIALAVPQLEELKFGLVKNFNELYMGVYGAKFGNVRSLSIRIDEKAENQIYGRLSDLTHLVPTVLNTLVHFELHFDFTSDNSTANSSTKGLSYFLMKRGHQLKSLHITGIPKRSCPSSILRSIAIYCHNLESLVFGCESAVNPTSINQIFAQCSRLIEMTFDWRDVYGIENVKVNPQVRLKLLEK